MKILVTGAAGFIGSHLAQRLHQNGHSVTGVDNFTDYYDTDLKEMNAADLDRDGILLLRLDLVSDALHDVLRDVEIIYHAAAQPGNSPQVLFESYVRNNLLATEHLLRSARAVNSLKCFVYVSTSSVYGKNAMDSEDVAPKPISPYGVTKLASEQLVLAHGRDKGLPSCSLRLFSVYGPRERPDKLYPRLIKSIAEETEFPLFEGSLNHTRSFTFIDDAIEGFVRVLDCPDKVQGEIFNIGSDIEISTEKGIDIVEEIMGKKVKIKHLPKRAGDQLHTSANIEKARNVLGYEPRTSLESGLLKQIKWYSEKFNSN